MNNTRNMITCWLTFYIGLTLCLMLALDVLAVSHWTEHDGTDFDSGTYSDTHLKDVSEGVAFIHLADDNTETHSVNNNANDQYPLLVDPGSGNNQWVGTYSQSFQPTFTGVVDKVELQVYKVGNPVDGDDDPALLTIKLNTANQNIPHNPLGTTLLERSYTASNIPVNAATWTTFYLTETDSSENTVLSANWHYAIVVTSNAVNNANNAFRWEFEEEDDANTDAMEKGYDLNGAVCWRQCVKNGNHYDYQFKIHVHDFIHSGSYISQVHDFGQNVNFVAVDLLFEYATLGSVTLFTRCGPGSTPDESWCDWIDQGIGNENPEMNPARYAQYKLDFIAGDNDDTTNSVRSVEISYI